MSINGESHLGINHHASAQPLYAHLLPTPGSIRAPTRSPGMGQDGNEASRFVDDAHDLITYICRDASDEEQYVFNGAQQDIEKVVESIIVGHAVLPLPKKVVIEGKGFTLTATRVRWDFANDLEFKWGHHEVQKMNDKWWFLFKVDNSGEP
ncbi:hypothetical protein CPB85DRAFT_1249415 [Mucidula mucida]|nr:hypothetical protein CPB85DRAFT_1249415 [Mucidula mucida]